MKQKREKPTGNRSEYKQYECEKRRISEKGLTPEEYQERIKEIAKKAKI